MTSTGLRRALSALGLAAVLAYPTARAVRSLRMTRGGVATFAALLAYGNAGDLGSARSLCSRRYLGAHTLRPSPEGGMVGLPRRVHPNFRAWAEGDEVRLCPTDRVGPVYRLVFEGGAWKFDGLAGLLGPGGEVVPGAAVEDSP